MWPFRVEWAGGFLDEEPVVSDGAGARRFDLASLTKVIATSTLLADHWLRNGGTDWQEFLGTPLAAGLDELRGTPLESLPLRAFWEHETGLAAHVLLFDPPRTRPHDRASALAAALRKIAGLARVNPGATVYSDLGYIVLGAWLERSVGMSINDQWERWKRAHLSPNNGLTFFASLDVDERALLEPTETDRHLAGEVNDDNCFSLGEMSSHAGLTGSALDVWEWMRALLAWEERDDRVVAWTRSQRGGARFACGWDTPSISPGGPRSQAGDGPPPSTRGHLGYTGTALWLDPESGLGGTLLTNRVFPRHNPVTQEIIRALRTEFFTALWQNEDLGRGQWIHTVKTRFPSATVS